MRRHRPPRRTIPWRPWPPCTELIARLDELLEPRALRRLRPERAPGARARGGRRSSRPASPPARELFERAIAAGAGLRPRPPRAVLEGPAARASTAPAKARLQLAVRRTTSSLAAYHLPLDAHLEHGNNALLAAALGAEPSTPFPRRRRHADRRRAHLPGDGLAPRGELVERARAAVGGREPLAFTRRARAASARSGSSAAAARRLPARRDRRRASTRSSPASRPSG